MYCRCAPKTPSVKVNNMENTPTSLKHQTRAVIARSCTLQGVTRTHKALGQHLPPPVLDYVIDLVNFTVFEERLLFNPRYILARESYEELFILLKRFEARRPYYDFPRLRAKMSPHLYDFVPYSIAPVAAPICPCSGNCVP
jgi:hypothetical protein